MLDTTGAQQVETDAAIAAADLLEKLDNGYYKDNNKRRKFIGDFSKLLHDFEIQLSAPSMTGIRMQWQQTNFWQIFLHLSHNAVVG